MRMNIEKCYYVNEAGICTVLMGTCCTGFKSVCSFRKTEQEHFDSLNDAIKANRAKGNCFNCKYRNMRCELSEKEEQDG